MHHASASSLRRQMAEEAMTWFGTVRGREEEPIVYVKRVAEKMGEVRVCLLQLLLLQLLLLHRLLLLPRAHAALGLPTLRSLWQAVGYSWPREPWPMGPLGMFNHGSGHVSCRIDCGHIILSCGISIQRP